MLEVKNLRARYGDSLVLDGVGIEVAAGQGVALLGRNGAGKTTLLKSIVGGGPTVDGTLRFMGGDLRQIGTHARARSGLALVPEDRRIFSHLTVEENLLLARHASGPRGTLPLQEAYGLFPALAELRTRMGNQLSGGQQQILAVARALMSRPKCMLLDEPTEGVAPLLVQQMAEQVNRARQQQGAALLLAEQNLWFSRRCTDYVFVIDTGRIVFEGDWNHFDAHPEIADRYLAV
ncbi:MULTISPECIES: ABC transporter ATP-binding protein [Achromobacter]|uniref:ABC transporter ATP-binding protein n=1 Tax=Alcaligenes xylosoxydans xylosoxydans TaxID=85698 RepID=A0A424WKD3_ALCXX|nr:MULTISPECIES: ABC transporter ATP-binding protein [Achromobacter]MBC9904098.1 ABC transporter ATP-binding protein [Achromobacter xylosoxidans]MBD0867943.1 ABC transporter ATP-binding protein [Achromobacter xylosoxidans]MDH1301632.1 ABC transporter ATP-binding protein [Achromobacter sp. GD03932]QNP86603.1 ABC transporter ATP-binding protein [Achromobacter xylosoxidans]RPJ93547.1 ABC transporter ATP-binding protein [Achromobacter xylosoxidans]